MKNTTKRLFMLAILGWGMLVFIKASAQSSPLSDISIRYCNDEMMSKDLNMIAQAGKATPICVQFTNTSPNPITINVEFDDSIITEGAIKDGACNASDRPKTQFANFIQPFDGETVLPAKSSIQKTYSIKYPIGYSGLSHGCLAYNVIGGDVNGSSMFTIRVRAMKFLNFFVTNAPVKQMVKMTENPIISKLGDERNIAMHITNEGNVDEKIHIKATIANILGFTRDFTFDQVIAAQSGIQIVTPGFILPIYGGRFRVTSKISYTPIFDFNIMDGKHPSEIYGGGQEVKKDMLFISTRQTWLAIAVLAAIIIAFIRKLFRRKVKTLS